MSEIKAKRGISDVEWASLFFQREAGESLEVLAKKISKGKGWVGEKFRTIRRLSDDEKQALKALVMEREFSRAEATLFAGQYFKARQHSMALMAHLKLQKERQAFMTAKPDQAGADLNDNKKAELSDIDTETLRAQLVQKALARNERATKNNISEDDQSRRTDRLPS